MEILWSFVVTPAWATDAFGVMGFINLIVQLVLMVGGAAVTIAGVIKGIEVIAQRGGLQALVPDIIALAVGIGIIVGSPALSRAAVPTAGGMALTPLMVYSLSQDIGETLGWFLTLGAYLAPGWMLWQTWRGRHADRV